MKMTKMQWVTLAALILYLAYEFILVRDWAAELPPSDPVIRVDLFIIYPILVILILVSLLQFLRKNRK